VDKSFFHYYFIRLVEKGGMMLGKLGRWFINHVKAFLYGLGFFFQISV
jgi:hypothetical protein